MSKRIGRVAGVKRSQFWMADAASVERIFVGDWIECRCYRVQVTEVEASGKLRCSGDLERVLDGDTFLVRAEPGLIVAVPVDEERLARRGHAIPKNPPSPVRKQQPRSSHVVEPTANTPMTVRDGPERPAMLDLYHERLEEEVDAWKREVDAARKEFTNEMRHHHFVYRVMIVAMLVAGLLLGYVAGTQFGARSGDCQGER